MTGKAILVFGGTSEGRVLTERLLDCGYAVTCSVATEYGSQLLKPGAGLTILEGRLTEVDMAELLRTQDFALVVDATHPYAAEVSGNIRRAAEGCGVPLYRLLRPRQTSDGVLWADSPEAAAQWLAAQEGGILLTTGSKDLKCFTTIPEYQKRLWVRILPSIPSLQLALEAGIPSAQLICMQGPFSVSMNVELLRHTGCRYLVTKDSGKAGGFREKVEAAQLAGATLLVIRRPTEESGYTLEELTELLCGKEVEELP